MLFFLRKFTKNRKFYILLQTTYYYKHAFTQKMQLFLESLFLKKIVERHHRSGKL